MANGTWQSGLALGPLLPPRRAGVLTEPTKGGLVRVCVEADGKLGLEFVGPPKKKKKDAGEGGEEVPELVE